MTMMTTTTVPFILIRVIFFLNPVLELCVTDNFPLFSANFNASACKHDSVVSVVSELIM